MVDGPVDEAGIAVADGIQTLVDGAEDGFVELAFVRVHHEHLGAHHRNQGQSTGSGHNHDDGHDPTQLLEHHASRAFDHGQRQEHGQHGQGGSDNRKRHFLRGMHGGFLRLLAAFDVGRDVFQDHDGIVHNHTDGNG